MIEKEQIDFREAPKNLEAEQALLGALLANNRALEKVGDFLRPYHFASPVHSKIYEACQSLIERGHIADPVTLQGYFNSTGSLDEVGGSSYLMKLAASSVTIINAEDYGRQIFDRYLRRELIDLGYEVVNEAFSISLDNDALSQIGSAEKKLFDLSSQGHIEGGLEAFSVSLREAIDEAERAKRNPDGISGVSSGLVDFDHFLGGLHPSDLIILAGRPGMGKTALATCIAFNAAKDFAEENKKEGVEKKSVAFFSLEMSSEQLASRVLSTETQIESHSMRTGRISASDFEKLAGAVSDFNRIPLYVDDTPGLTVSAIRTRARRMKRDKEKGLGLIVIDYIQLIDSSDVRNQENRVQVLSEITRGLKILAKELDVPVLALSQLSRQVEQREDKRPLLSDLRESGSIEQDADVVLFVFREIYYLEREIPVQRANETEEKFQQRYSKWEERVLALQNKAELIIAKQRHGATGTVNLYFNGKYTQFGSLDIGDRQ